MEPGPCPSATPQGMPRGVLQFYSAEATAVLLASAQAPWGNWQRSRAFLSGRRVLFNLGRGSCHVARARLGLRASCDPGTATAPLRATIF